MNNKYKIVGLQFPGEESVTKDGIWEMMDHVSGYYLDFIRIDGNSSSAYFLIDSDVYQELEEKMLLNNFKDMIKIILNDTEAEAKDGIYEFNGDFIWFQYM
jgi:chemotaxis protein CheY-P-specific phosphatase CheC